jgi:hypothetical protein
MRRTSGWHGASSHGCCGNWHAESDSAALYGLLAALAAALTYADGHFAAHAVG